MSLTTTLQGDYGSGKSKMAVTTCINPPVYCLDIDRKMRGAAWAQPLIASGALIVKEISEPVDETNMVSRLTALSKELTKKGPTTRPQGYVKFAEAWYDLPKQHAKTPFGTVLCDSATLLSEHMKSMIMFDAGRSKLTFDQWTALKICWMDTFSIMRDTCIENGWDLIVTVHERVKEEPGANTTGIRLESIMTASGELSTQKIPLGTQDIKVWASIDGAFGDLIGALCDEYYWLYVKMERDVPQWRCRVKPDGRRSLRTTFDTGDRVEFNPNFKEIWKP